MMLSIWWLLILSLLIAADQSLKCWTVSTLAQGESASFLPGFLQLTRVHNYGAAWSSLSGQRVILLLLTAVLMVAVGYVLLRRLVRHPLGVAAGLLLLGGGIGNFIDRVRLGYVVDMFDLQFIHYPVFNLADCFIVVGTVLGAIYYLCFYEKYDKVENDDADSHN